ncbi:MAG: AAA family ATPase [DPANN group archaeon]|nr:AAA family ATPase [DPANN group archaeon]
MAQDMKALNLKAEEYASLTDKVIGEVKKVVVGNDDVLDKLMISLIAGGHTLLEGLPGLAKTLMIKTLSDTTHADFRRLQFTPDLLPSDILGTKIYNQKTATFSTKKGPVFSNFILADEINRAPPKVQSALLEAMQECQVTIAGETFPLPKPFLVLATQNPIETEGTYPLPEAQLDRFMFKIPVKYASLNDEKEIVRRMTSGVMPSAKKVIDIVKIIEMQKFCHSIYADEKVINYVTDIVNATRNPDVYGLDFTNFVAYGASPRASIWLTLGAKAHALMNGRAYVIPEDIKGIAPDVLRHRVLMTYEADAENIDSSYIINKVLNVVNVP